MCCFIWAIKGLGNGAQNSNYWKFKVAATAILDVVLDHICVFDKDIWVKFRKLAIGGLSWRKIKLSIKFKMAVAAILKIHKQASPNF